LYKQGKYYERSLEFNPGQHEIILNSVQGDFISKFQTVELILHGFKAGLQFKVNGLPVAGSNGTTQRITFGNEAGKISIYW
jgi:alpha-glucosidase